MAIEWILVSERVPEDERTVLLWIGSNELYLEPEVALAFQQYAERHPYGWVTAQDVDTRRATMWAEINLPADKEPECPK